MEKFPDLQGLFDDMNTFNFSKLLNDWQGKLSNSKQFKKVFESASKTNRNDWNPKQGSHNPTYNKSDDEQIRLTNYINWLDQDQTPKTSSDNKRTNGKNHSVKLKSVHNKPDASLDKHGKGKSKETTNGGL